MGTSPPRQREDCGLEHRNRSHAGCEALNIGDPRPYLPEPAPHVSHGTARSFVVLRPGRPVDPGVCVVHWWSYRGLGGPELYAVRYRHAARVDWRAELHALVHR